MLNDCNALYSTFREKIVEFLDLSLLQELIYVNICIGMAFALFSDVSFFTIQPVYLQELKFTKVKPSIVFQNKKMYIAL